MPFWPSHQRKLSSIKLIKLIDQRKGNNKIKPEWPSKPWIFFFWSKQSLDRCIASVEKGSFFYRFTIFHEWNFQTQRSWSWVVNAMCIKTDRQSSQWLFDQKNILEMKFTFHPGEASHESMFMWLRPPRHPRINYARFNCILFFLRVFVLWSRLIPKKRTGFLCLSVVFFNIQFIAIFFSSQKRSQE